MVKELGRGRGSSVLVTQREEEDELWLEFS